MKRFFVVLFLSSIASAQPAPDIEPPAATGSAPPAAAPPHIDTAALAALIDERIAAQPKTAGYMPGTGFYLRTGDDSAKLRIGGYTQFDGRFFYNESSPSQIDQFGFRSIRPELLGTVFDHYDFRLLPDFAGGKLVVQEAYVDVHYTDAFVLRFGKSKVPFGLERLQPEVATTFTERGLPSLLTPNRDLGIQAFGTVGLLSYQLAVVNGIADNGSTDADTSDHKELVAHLLATPLPGLGLGAAGTYGIEHGTPTQTDLGTWTTAAQTVFFQYNPGALADGLHWRATAHAFYYAGPLGLMAEYVRSQQHVGLGPTHAIVAADAWQALAQYVVVGGTSTYRGVIPTGRRAALSISARLGSLRLSDSTAFTVGLADPARSARSALSTSIGFDWLPDRSFRFLVDLDRTTFRSAALVGDGAPETSVIGRVQTVF